MHRTLFFLLLSLSTLKAQQALRIAIIGCHRQFEPAPSLVRYLEAQPDLCLWIGDNVYADTRDDFSYIERCYEAMAQNPPFSCFASCPLLPPGTIMTTATMMPAKNMP